MFRFLAARRRNNTFCFKVCEVRCYNGLPMFVCIPITISLILSTPTSNRNYLSMINIIFTAANFVWLIKWIGKTIFHCLGRSTPPELLVRMTFFPVYVRVCVCVITCICVCVCKTIVISLCPTCIRIQPSTSTLLSKCFCSVRAN